MTVFQYICLKALRLLDRDYMFLIWFLLVPSLNQSFILDALRTKRKETRFTLSFLHPAAVIMQ